RFHLVGLMGLRSLSLGFFVMVVATAFGDLEPRSNPQPLAAEARMEGYRYVTTTLEGFVHQVASRYVASGYRHYIRGHVPRGKDPDAIDRKLLAKYDIALSKWERYRRRRRHEGCVHYIRFERTFLLLAIPGPHTRFFEEERVRDIAAEPIVV